MYCLTRRWGLKKMGNTIYNLDDLRLSPEDGSFTAVVNDEICMRIAAGKIHVRPGTH